VHYSSTKHHHFITMLCIQACHTYLGTVWHCRWGIVAGALLIVFLVVGAEATYGYWIFSYSVEELHFTDQFAAFINSAFWGAFTAGRILGVLAAAALGPVTLLVLMLPLSIIGSALPLLVPMDYQSQWFIMATSCAVGFGNSTGYANAVSMLEMFVPVTGMINGLFGTVAGGSNMIAPVLVALLAKYTDLGFQSVMWVVLVMYLVSLATVVGTSYLGQKLKSLQLEEQQDDLVEPLLGGSEGGSEEEEQQQGAEISMAGEADAAGEAASAAGAAGEAASAAGEAAAAQRSSGAGAGAPGPQQV
jgi:MFS family permease